MLVTCIHCSDYSAEGILKIVLFLATSFRPIMDLHVFASLVFIMDQCAHIAFV